MKGKLKNNQAITLVALVITIVIIIILATIAMNFVFGENGLITKAQQAAEMTEIARIQEELEMAKGTAAIDGLGEIDPDHYFDIIEDEGIIDDKETDVEDNGDGSYDAAAMFNNTKWSYLFPYNGTFKDYDNNYLTDYNQMQKLGIANIQEYYWLASRATSPSSYACYMLIRCVNSNGEDSSLRLVNLSSVSPTKASYAQYRGLRPVFKLKDNIKITGGSGTESDPYTLGV